MEDNSVVFAKALADETRQEIMRHLCCVWLNVGDLVDALGGRVNQPTVSHHLRKLQEAGLVLARHEGRQHLYTLDQEKVTVCCGQLLSAFAPEMLEHMLHDETGMEIWVQETEEKTE